MPDFTPLAPLDRPPADLLAGQSLPRETGAAAILALGRLEGQCRLADPRRITGWARNLGAPGRKVLLEVLVDGEPLGTVRADLPRKDLAATLGEDIRVGFILQLPRPLSAHGERRVTLRRAADHAELKGSPIVLPHAPPDQVAALAELARSLATAAAEADAAARADLARMVAERLAALLPARPPRQAALLERWGVAGPGQVPPAHLAPAPRPRALVIDDGVPDPARDAGSSAVVSHMRALLGLGYAVEFVASLALAQEGPATRALAGMGVTCWHLPWAASAEEVLRRAGPELDLVYIHRYGPMQRYGALVRHWAPQARLVYCVADLHWLRAARAADLAEADDAPAEAPWLADPARLPDAIAGLRAAELTAVLGADAVITHSSHEADMLARDVPEAAVHLLPWAIVPRPATTPFDDRPGVAFVGSYQHAPNLDAAETLLDRVMPLVWAQDPSVTLLLAGSDLPASLRARAEAAPGPVEVLGHVPDLSAVWERTRLTVAPLRFGAGLKGKVLDSLAAGIPCLCSPVAAEGMDLPPALRPLVADSHAAMAEAILRLYDDEAACTTLGEAGLDWITTRFAAARIETEMRAVAGLEA